MSHQRWHEWRNMDTTTCPSHGVVRIVVPETGPQVEGVIDPGNTLIENEVLGPNIILHGKRPNYNFDADTNDYYLPSLHRGISTYFAINGHVPVGPGEVGLLTFDLPSWIVVDRMPRGGALSGVVDLGNYITAFSDWVAHFHVIQQDPLLRPLQIGSGLLYVFALDTTNMRVLAGVGTVYTVDDEIIEDGGIPG